MSSGLTAAFPQMQSLDVKIDQIKILDVETPPSPSMPGLTVPPPVPTSLRLSCHISQVLIAKDGTKKATEVTPRIMRLRRNAAGNWIIDTYES